MSHDEHIRERIRKRLAEIGMSDADLSKRIGKNDGWAHDYLRAKQPSPRRLPLELAMSIAQVIGVEPEDLGVPATPPASVLLSVSGFSDSASNAEPWSPPAGHFLTASPHITYYRMTDGSLDQDERRVRIGSVLAFRTGNVRTPDLRMGDIVWCQTVDRDDPMRSLGSLIGIWIPPNKVVSNAAANNWIHSIDDAGAKRQLIVRGVMMGVVDFAEPAAPPAGPSHRPSALR